MCASMPVYAPINTVPGIAVIGRVVVALVCQYAGTVCCMHDVTNLYLAYVLK